MQVDVIKNAVYQISASSYCYCVIIDFQYGPVIVQGEHTGR